MGNYHGLIVYFYKKKRLCKNSLSYHFRLNPESHPGLIINVQDEVADQVSHNKIKFRQPPGNTLQFTRSFFFSASGSFACHNLHIIFFKSHLAV